jgi:hypothetical protein
MSFRLKRNLLKISTDSQTALASGAHIAETVTGIADGTKEIWQLKRGHIRPLTVSTTGIISRSLPERTRELKTEIHAVAILSTHHISKLFTDALQ